MSDPERREEERLRAALVSLNVKIQALREREAADPGLLAALEDERAARRSAYEAFETAAYARHPELSRRRGRTIPVNRAEAGRLVPDVSVALLEYAVTERGSFLFVLTRESGAPKLDAFALAPGRRSLEELAGRFRERLASRSLAHAEDARALYDRLLAPARGLLRSRTHLVVVPDGPLWEVPFQALLDPAGRYVIESAAVSYAPSLTVLRETLRAPASTAVPRTLLAMGQAGSVAPLPEAERQVRLIGALYDPDHSVTYLGPDAREDRFKAEAPRRSVVHLASHGVLEEASPLYSHVVLAPGPSGSSEDGLLEAWEVLDLELDADLVVLSACETGRGRIAPGEGIVGTMWSFFVAGSRALLVSQWKAESASTTELMTAFHRGLAREDGSKAAHLRRASLELMRQPRYAHPFYWAAFVLVGNPY